MQRIGNGTWTAEEAYGAVMPEGDIETYHQAGAWHNRIEGSGETIGGSHDTREAAITAGRAEATRRKVEHIVHTTWMARSVTARATVTTPGTSRVDPCHLGDPGDLFEVGSAVLHYADGHGVKRDIYLLDGRAPGEFDAPVAGDRYDRFRLRIWHEDLIHYHQVEWVQGRDGGPA